MSQKVIRKVVESEEDEEISWEASSEEEEVLPTKVISTKPSIASSPATKETTRTTALKDIPNGSSSETEKSELGEKKVKDKLMNGTQDEGVFVNMKDVLKTRVENKLSDDTTFKSATKTATNGEKPLTNGEILKEENLKIMNGNSEKKKFTKEEKEETKGVDNVAKRSDETSEVFEDKPPQNPHFSTTSSKVKKTKKKEDYDNHSSSIEKEEDAGVRKKKVAKKKKKSVDGDDDNASVSSSNEKKVKKVKKKSVDGVAVESAEGGEAVVKKKKKKESDSDVTEEKSEKKKSRKKDGNDEGVKLEKKKEEDSNNSEVKKKSKRKSKQLDSCGGSMEAVKKGETGNGELEINADMKVEKTKVESEDLAPSKDVENEKEEIKVEERDDAKVIKKFDEDVKNDILDSEKLKSEINGLETDKKTCPLGNLERNNHLTQKNLLKKKDDEILKEEKNTKMEKYDDVLKEEISPKSDDSKKNTHFTNKEDNSPDIEDVMKDKKFEKENNFILKNGTAEKEDNEFLKNCDDVLKKYSIGDEDDTSKNELMKKGTMTERDDEHKIDEEFSSNKKSHVIDSKINYDEGTMENKENSELPKSHSENNSTEFTENIDEWMKSILSKHKLTSEFLTQDNSVDNDQSESNQSYFPSTSKDKLASYDDLDESKAQNSTRISKTSKSIGETKGDITEKQALVYLDDSPKQSSKKNESFLNKTYENSDEEVEAVSRYLAKRFDKEAETPRTKKGASDDYNKYSKKERSQYEDEEYEEERSKMRAKRRSMVVDDEEEGTDEGFMARFRREKQGRVSSKNDRLYQPMRGDETEEKVRERTRHVRALMDKQKSVMESIQTASKKICDLEGLVRESKAEVLEQRSNMEGLEELLDAVYKQYESEVSSAMMALTQQKRPKSEDLKQEVENVLNDVRMYTKPASNATKNLFNGGGLEEFERVSATPRSSWGNLWESIGGSSKQRSNGATEDEYNSLKNRRVSFAGDSSNEFMNGDKSFENGQADDKNSTNDFISKIRNKYSIPSSDQPRKFTSSNSPSNRSSLSDFSLLDSKYRKSITEDIGKTSYRTSKHADPLLSKYSSKEKYEDPPTYKSYLPSSLSYSSPKPSSFSYFSKTPTAPSYQSKFLRASKPYL